MEKQDQKQNQNQTKNQKPETSQKTFLANSTTSQNETLTKMEFPKHWMTQILKRLIVIFPGNYIFTLDADTENFVNVWCSGLVGFTGDEIKTGLQACTNILDPPNLARFKTLCRQPKPKQNTKAYQTVKYLQLQNLDINSIAAKAEMRLIKIITNASLDDDDFDDETEYELTRYYAKRTITQNDHIKVKDFLAAYRSD